MNFHSCTYTSWCARGSTNFHFCVWYHRKFYNRLFKDFLVVQYPSINTDKVRTHNTATVFHINHWLFHATDISSLQPNQMLQSQSCKIKSITCERKNIFCTFVRIHYKSNVAPPCNFILLQAICSNEFHDSSGLVSIVIKVLSIKFYCSKASIAILFK